MHCHLTNNLGDAVPRFSLVRPERWRVDFLSEVNGERLGGAYRSSEGTLITSHPQRYALDIDISASSTESAIDTSSRQSVRSVYLVRGIPNSLFRTLVQSFSVDHVCNTIDVGLCG